MSYQCKKGCRAYYDGMRCGDGGMFCLRCMDAAIHAKEQAEQERDELQRANESLRRRLNECESTAPKSYFGWRERYLNGTEQES